MRKIIICIGLIVFVAGPYFFLHSNSRLSLYLKRQLNKDTVLLQDGGCVFGWIWDEKGGLLVGETVKGDIFILNKDEYKEIERNTLLAYLRGLI